MVLASACVRTDALPRVQSIKWELWTNSNDECGTLCNQQLDFIRVGAL